MAILLVNLHGGLEKLPFYVGNTSSFMVRFPASYVSLLERAFVFRRVGFYPKSSSVDMYLDV